MSTARASADQATPAFTPEPLQGVIFFALQPIAPLGQPPFARQPVVTHHNPLHVPQEVRAVRPLHRVSGSPPLLDSSLSANLPVAYHGAPRSGFSIVSLSDSGWLVPAFFLVRKGCLSS